MDSPPYHYYHYYDPTIINTHTLLKPQPYQQPNYITHTQLPSYHTPSISTTTDLASLINQLVQSQQNFQRTFQHNLSVLASEVSHFKTSLTPSVIHHTPHQEPSSSSPCEFQHLIHQPQIHTSTALIHPHHTAQQQIWASHRSPHHHPFPYKPFIQQSPANNCIDQHIQHRPDPLSLTTAFVPLNSEPSQKGEDEIVQPHELVVNGNRFFPSSDSNSQVTVYEKKRVNDVDVNIVIEPSVVNTTFVGESVVTVSASDENSTTHTAVKKEQATAAHHDSLLTSQSFSLPLILVPSQHRFSATTTPSTEKKVVCAVVVTKTPLQHPLFIFELSDVSIHIFDPGGNESRFLSPAAIFANFYSTLPLLVPWDRGKLGVSKSLFSVKRVFINCLSSAAVSFPTRGTAFGWPWVPWSSKTPMVANVTGAVTHVKEEEAIRVNWELKSLKFSIDFIGPSYVGLLHFHVGPKLLRRNGLWSKNLGIMHMDFG